MSERIPAVPAAAARGAAECDGQRMAHHAELGRPSRSLYTSGRCRCAQCLALDRSYRRNRTQPTLEGNWSPRVPTGPVREHLRLLRRGGASVAEIPTSAGVTESAIASIIYPSRTAGEFTSRVGRATAEAVMAVRPVQLSPARVDRSSTVARLQVLVALGWPYRVLAQRLGVSPNSIWQLTRRRGRVQSGTAAAIQTIAEQIGGRPPMPGVDAAPTAISRARTAARRSGWLI